MSAASASDAAKLASAAQTAAPCCVGHVHHVTIKGKEIDVDKGKYIDVVVCLTLPLVDRTLAGR